MSSGICKQDVDHLQLFCSITHACKHRVNPPCILLKSVVKRSYLFHHTVIYVLNVALCWSFFCSSVNLPIYVLTRLTAARANNTFDFSIKAGASSLDRQIVSRSQRAYALGVVQVRLNLIVLIGIFLFWNIFADYNYILHKFLLFSRISKWRLPTLWEFSNDFSTQVA